LLSTFSPIATRTSSSAFTSCTQSTIRAHVSMMTTRATFPGDTFEI